MLAIKLNLMVIIIIIKLNLMVIIIIITIINLIIKDGLMVK